MMLHAPGFGALKTPGGYYSGFYQVAAKPHAFTVKTPWPAPATGTVQISGTSVIGTGTHFNSQFNVDDVIDVLKSVGDYESRVVTSVADNTHLTVNFPFTFAAANLAIAVGDPALAVGSTYVRLTLDRKLTESYLSDPIKTGSTGDVSLNDGVEKVSSNTTPVSSTDYFDVTDLSALTGGAEAQWQNPFPSAFTEYVVLPNAAPPVPHAILTPAPATQRFIDKWFSSPIATLTGVDPTQADSYTYAPPPNQQLLLIGDSDDADVSKSEQNGFLSNLLAAERASVIDRGTVEFDVNSTATALNGANADTVLRRTTVHELTHQWWPNGILFGAAAGDHCRGLASYDSQAAYPAADGLPPAGLKFCLMSDPFSSPMMPASWNPGQTINMVRYFYRYAYTSYHAAALGTGCHSEYLAIRQTVDPWTP